MYFRPRDFSQRFADRTAMAPPRRNSPLRVSVPVNHMQEPSEPDRPPRISADGYYDTLSIELQVNNNPSENTSSLSLNRDHLTIRIPPPRIDTQSSVVESNKRKRSNPGNSTSTSSDSSDCSPPTKQFCRTLQVLEDFLRLFTNPNSFQDAIFKCGHTEIPFHKCILSARSPVFEALFKSEMMESSNGIVEIVDIEPDVLEAMLIYVYSGKIDHITATLAEDLLFAADKYQIVGLKSACIKILKKGMTQNNILRILVLGELHDKSLKEYAIGYISRHLQFSEVESTDEWKQLQAERSKLAMEVLLAVVKNIPKGKGFSEVRLDTVIAE